MRILLLGRGKTGSMVAQVAQERGHSVRTMTERENVNGSALTPPFLTQFDVVIDFTNPQAAIENMRACLAAGSRMVVGTTGWHDRLHEIRSLADRRGGSLLYGSNFSTGVQFFLKLAAQFAREMQQAHGYSLRIEETHHTTKVDAPSGTAKTLQQLLERSGVKTEITSHRQGDVVGMHAVIAATDSDAILLQHEAFSRRGFAEGAVRGAEWLLTRSGVYDFQDIYADLP